MGLILRSLALSFAIAVSMAQTAPKQGATVPKAVPQKAVAAKKSTPQTVVVTFTTDIPCKVGVDGKLVAELQTGEPKKIPLSVREHKLEAISLANSTDRWEGAIDLTEKKLEPAVKIELFPIQNRRREEERKIRVPKLVSDIVKRATDIVVGKKENDYAFLSAYYDGDRDLLVKVTKFYMACFQNDWIQVYTDTVTGAAHVSLLNAAKANEYFGSMFSDKELDLLSYELQSTKKKEDPERERLLVEAGYTLGEKK